MATVVAGSAVVALGVTPSSAAPVSGNPPLPGGTGPADDSFYTPPSPLPQGQPGDVIRWRPARPGPRGAIANSWQIMYLSNSALGKPIAVTGTIIMPKSANPATAPIAAVTSGTQGPAFLCAPSIMEQTGSHYEQPAIDDFIKAGYAIALPDYEGYKPDPKTTYMTGQSMGRTTLDAVRAAQKFSETKVAAGAKVVLKGYSQGGGAAMWAGQLHPTYAPELNLVGVAAGGVPADLVMVGLPLDAKWGSGFFLYALLGLANAYPELDLYSALTPAGKAAYDDMSKDSCTFELLTKYANKKISDYFTQSVFVTPAWAARLAENKLGATPIKVPVYQYHGSADNIVAFGQADTLHKTYCGAGVNLTWKVIPDQDHITPIYIGNAEAFAFLQDRVAGKPATSNC
ncbi:lipase family protein [Actinokineospora iranica]|nr:lipase family protein [Actinokineospora iranica]